MREGKYITWDDGMADCGVKYPGLKTSVGLGLLEAFASPESKEE